MRKKMVGFLVIFLLFMCMTLISKDMFQILLFVMWMAFTIGGFAHFISVLKRLEQGIDRLPNFDAFLDSLKDSNDSTCQNLMHQVIKLHTSIEEKYTVKMMDKQSKINSLQSQINPHFLYNTLECIRSEAIVLKCESIAYMAKALASFFRYNISRKENIVTILDEIGNIENYFLIQNYRFENKFQFFIKVENNNEEIYSYLIPKMTIQPIIENSIFHGLETKSGDCYIHIHISTTEDKVILIISDNGIGMSKETLEKLQYGMEHGSEEGKNEISAHGNGIALYNVNQRIKLTFGNEYGLQVYSTQGIGTDIEIIMPIITNKVLLKF